MSQTAELFINNEYTKGSKGASFTLKSPATEQEIGKAYTASPEDVDQAVAYAEKGQFEWSEMGATERGQIMRKFAMLVKEQAADLAQYDAMAMGRPISTNVDGVAFGGLFEYITGLGEAIHGESSLNTKGFLTMNLRQPFGVTAGILPWNFPIALGLQKIAPSVAAGNAIILKTSEKAPFAVAKLGALIKEAGFPAGVVQIIHGKGDVGQLLSEHMKIRKVSFTGSTRTGRAVMTSAANSNLKNVTLELGGKSPTLIFDDANLDEAVPACALSIGFNSGQVCIASSRLYVQEGIYDKFLKAFAEAFNTYKQGDPLDKSTTMGPQADEIQRDIVAKYIEIGNKEGKALIGGKKAEGKGFFFEPTIFTDVAHDARVNKEEVFGPVVVVHKFKTEEEGLALANDSEYGLYSAVFTQDIDRAVRVAKYLQAGTVGINCNSPTQAFDMPFGGWKGSGIGRENGLGGLEAWLEHKTVLIKIAHNKESNKQRLAEEMKGPVA